MSSPGITSTSRIRETGEKKCVPRKCWRRSSLSPAASDVIGIDEVFEADTRISGNDPVKTREDLAFDRFVFEHCFDGEVTIAVIVQSADNAQIGQSGLGSVFRPEAAADAAFEDAPQPIRHRRGNTAVLIPDDGLMTGNGKHQGDLRPHHSRADHANRPELLHG